MLQTNDWENSIGSFTLTNFRTLLPMFSFQAFRAVKLIQQIAATSKVYLFCTPCNVLIEGEGVHIYIFAFCPTNFLKTTVFKRN